MADFYLVSTELRQSYKPRSCQIVKRVKSEIRDDLALVRITPPLPKDIYGTDADIYELVLGARYEGSSLFPISEWPTAVYICRCEIPLDQNDDTIGSEQLTILDWGEIRSKPT